MTLRSKRTAPVTGPISIALQVRDVERSAVFYEFVRTELAHSIDEPAARQLGRSARQVVRAGSSPDQRTP